jgi:hypothetical protein
MILARLPAVLWENVERVGAENLANDTAGEEAMVQLLGQLKLFIFAHWVYSSIPWK